mmetsp:Transcript_41712/g.74843  ORF Transcript_41712/g.74843 Transcript_41712/m.74843 type:complete len:129 (-) Transcript_41712:569-955(-)
MTVLTQFSHEQHAIQYTLARMQCFEAASANITSSHVGSTHWFHDACCRSLDFPNFPRFTWYNTHAWRFFHNFPYNTYAIVSGARLGSLLHFAHCWLLVAAHLLNFQFQDCNSCTCITESANDHRLFGQ